MNRSDFLSMMGNSGPSDRAGISEVNELINIFPYFQSAYMVLLKGLNNTDDVKFMNQLKISAMNVADREVLYYMLQNKSLRKETETETETLSEEAGDDVNETITEPSSTPGLITVPDTREIEQTVIESAKNSEQLIDEIEKENSRVSSGAEGHSVIISEAFDDDRDAAIIIMDEESGIIEEKIVYMDPGFSVSEPEELLELEAVTDAGAVEDQAGDEPMALRSQLELIDKFIMANPRIEPSKEKTDKPAEDLARPFVEAREEFVTETLARIYVKQGYYSRAIAVYDKLSLKFPEKSSYFAAQIEKIKELIK